MRALVFILALPTTDIINVQTAGGVWMINALPAIVLALYIRRLNTWAVIARLGVRYRARHRVAGQREVRHQPS